MKRKVKRMGLGDHIAGARILVTTEYRIGETDHRLTLSDTRLDHIGEGEEVTRADLWLLFDNIRAQYANYDDGEVTVELSIKDYGVNWS